MDVQSMLESAAAAAQAGDAAGAAESCRRILAIDPQQPDALHMLGVIALHEGRLSEAIEFVERAVAADPNATVFLLSLGRAHARANDVPRAIDVLSNALAQDEDFAEAHEALATCLDRANRPADALPHWRAAAKLDPKRFDLLNNLGVSHHAAAEYAEAADAFAQAAALAPRRADIQTNLAKTLERLGRPTEALAAAELAVALDPNYASAHNVVGVMLGRQRRFDDAIDSIERSLRLDPHSADAHNNLAQALLSSGDVAASIASCQRAIEAAPNWPVPAASILMASNYLPRLEPRELFDRHVEWARRYASGFASLSHHNIRDPNRPLRIGLMSADFRAHPVHDFLQCIFRHRDRAQMHLTAYSDVVTPDPVTAQTRALADTWRHIVGHSDERVAAQVADDQIDILIDLAGHSADNRLLVFARKPAPVQITYLGYCNTTGLSQMDYVLADEITDPPNNAQPYTEQLAYLPGCFCSYSPGETPPVNASPAQQSGVVTFVSPHALAKLNDDVIALWAKVLAATPRSRVLVWRDTLTARARTRLAAIFDQHGVANECVEFRATIPRPHLLLYHEADIVLDAFPWSGHTTACEAAWVGVPTVTLRGRTHAGRMAASALTSAGLGEFVAESPEQYVAIAVNLASDLIRLSELRQNLRAAMASSRLCDGAAFTRDFERVLRSLWVKWCEPEH